MIVNQSSGGSSGDENVWKNRYTNESSAYTGHGNMTYTVKLPNVSRYQVSGYAIYRDSSNNQLAVGRFASNLCSAKESASGGFYTDQTNSYAVIQCGYLSTFIRNGELEITATLYPGSFDTATVIFVQNIFYQEG